MRSFLPVLVALTLVPTLATAGEPSTALSKATTQCFFVKVWSTDGPKKDWELGTSLMPGDRAAVSVGKVLCVLTPAGADRKAAPSGVQEVQLGLQLSVNLDRVEGSAFTARLHWSADGEIGRGEHHVDRKSIHQTTRVAGKVGLPQLVGLMSTGGGAERQVHLLVEAQ